MYFNQQIIEKKSLTGSEQDDKTKLNVWTINLQK